MERLWTMGHVSSPIVSTNNRSYCGLKCESWPSYRLYFETMVFIVLSTDIPGSKP